MIDAFDSVVNDMMQEFGTTAYVAVVTQEAYDPQTSENTVVTTNYKVKAIFFDYIDKSAGAKTEKNTLVQTGDKQVFIQPPHKMDAGVPLPHLQAGKDRLKVADKLYNIVAVKQHNTTLTKNGCVLYELYVRE